MVTLILSAVGAGMGYIAWSNATGAPQQLVALSLAMAAAIVPYVIMRAVAHLE